MQSISYTFEKLNSQRPIITESQTREQSLRTRINVGTLTGNLKGKMNDKAKTRTSTPHIPMMDQCNYLFRFWV